jgi:hypothetical protein
VRTGRGARRVGTRQFVEQPVRRGGKPLLVLLRYKVNSNQQRSAKSSPRFV